MKLLLAEMRSLLLWFQSNIRCIVLLGILFLLFFICFRFFVSYFIYSPRQLVSSNDSFYPSPSATVDTVTSRPTVAPISLAGIFDDVSFVAQEDDVVLYATGDIIPARLTDARIRKYGVDYPFVYIAPVLEQADVVVANLESPLLRFCPFRTEGMIFCGVADFAGALRRHFISVVTLENNHIFDYGVAGREETLRSLSKQDIAGVLLGEPVIKTYKGVRFGFAAVNGVGNRIDLERLRSDIYSLRDLADVVVVSVHWGREYTYLPQSVSGIAPDDPVVLGKALVDMGTDLVLGNHPHWVQGVLLYKHGFIAFSHGNFIFDQAWSDETVEGVVGSYVFRDKRLVDVSFLPVVIFDYAQPRLADDIRSRKILQRMYESSISIAQF